MSFKYNKDLVGNAQKLRKDMTKEEKHLWYDFLKKLQVTVNRQKNIGNYILDFYISSAKIAIELDGSQHGLSKNRESDRIRDKELFALGIKVLRYNNKDVNQNFSAVCRDILNNLGID